MNKLKNRFDLSEWSGVVGDLGALLSLVFGLVVLMPLVYRDYFFCRALRAS